MKMILPSTLAGLPADTPVLLALSGGADSSALLHMLLCAGVPVRAAHVNHGIRGAAADRDEAFCRALAGKYGIPLSVLRADVPAIASADGTGLEEAARGVRYGFFRREMEQHGIPILATAHNADDNLETLLFHVVRGSGPRGGCGIPPVRPFDESGKFVIVRPILGMTKDEVFAYCRANGINYVTDETNADTAYSRNRLRSNVLPELKKLNPDASGAALRFCEMLREDNSYLDAQAASLADGTDNADALAALPDAILSRTLVTECRRAGAEPAYAHVRALMLALRAGRGSVALPGGITAHVGDGRLIFRADARLRRADTPQYPAPACVPLRFGENRVPGCAGTLVVSDDAKKCNKSCRGIYNLSINVSLNIDTIIEGLFIRPRQPGDRIRIGGMSKSIKKLLCDAHTPLDAETRRALPVVCDREGIVWVPFLPPRDGFRAAADAPDSPAAVRRITVSFVPDEGTPQSL